MINRFNDDLLVIYLKMFRVSFGSTVLKDDIIDVSVDNRGCLVNRFPEQKGGFLWLFAKHGNVKFKSVKVFPLKGN